MPSAPQMTGTPIADPRGERLRRVVLGRDVRSHRGEHGLHFGDRLADIAGEVRQDPHGLERSERGEPQMPERCARLIAGRDAHDRDTGLGGLLGDRASRGHDQHPTAALQGRAERRERLRGVPGVGRAHHERVRAAMLGQDRRAVHLHGKAEALEEHGPHDVSRDRRAAHPAERHRGDALRGGEAFGQTRGVVRGAAIARHAEHGVEHALRVRQAQCLGIVEVGHRLPPRFSAGFSASSISMTGMSSRTGYR